MLWRSLCTLAAAALALCAAPAQEPIRFARTAGCSPDGKYINFRSTRSTAYPPGSTLYHVPFEGGAETQLPFGDAKDIAFSPRGEQVAYVRGPGLWYRKGYRGSSNDDIWLANS